MSNTPTRVNESHFSTEVFPEIIAFCERDETTHVKSATEENYDYTFLGKTRYNLKKYSDKWELVELEEHQPVRVSAGKSLGMVLWQALRFTMTDKAKQDERVNILVPIPKGDLEKALAFMYYYGGYPGNFMEMTPEMEIILNRFVDPNITFLAYSHVPLEYLEWLRELMKQKEILDGEGPLGNFWVYKK